MKKAIIVVLIILGIFMIRGCGSDGTGTSNYENTNISDIDKVVADDSYVQEEMEYLYKYVADNNITYPQFDEYVEIANTFTESTFNDKWGNYVYVDADPSFKDNKSYTETLETSDYIYWGELNKDNKPDGIGILYECYYYLDYDYSNPDLLIKYIGEFKDGYYSGYGIEFEIPDWDKDYYYIDETEETLYLFNQPIYEGYFEEGIKTGTGVEIISTLGEINDEDGDIYIDYENAIIDPNAAEYSLFIGEYRKGSLEGDVLVYYNGSLLYEGEYNNDNMDGEGTLYFTEPKGVVKYEGEFSGGAYHGKGILYDENGEVVHKGKFASGDIK